MRVTEPRDWLQPRSRFGLDDPAAWRNDSGTRTPSGRLALRAAQIQHDIALVVRSEMRRTTRLRTYEAVVTATGIEVAPRYLGELLRGERPVSLRHVVALETEFGPLLIAGARGQRLADLELRVQAQRRAATGPRHR